MKKILFASSILFASACGDKIDKKLDELSGIVDAMCKCTDKDCAEKQQDAFRTWKKGNSKDDQPNESQQKKFEELRSKLSECRGKAEGTGAGGTAPTP